MYKLCLIFVFCGLMQYGKAQIGIGTSNIESSASLEISPKLGDDYKGVLISRMTTAERNQIANPADGLLIYNLDTDELNIFNGNVSGNNWEEIENQPENTVFSEMKFGRFKPFYGALPGVEILNATVPPLYSMNNTQLYSSVVSNGEFAKNDLFSTDVAYKKATRYSGIVYNISGAPIEFSSNTNSYNNPMIVTGRNLENNEGVFIDGDGEATFNEAQNIYISVTGPVGSPHIGRKFLIGFNVFKEDIISYIIQDGNAATKNNQGLITYIFEFK